MYGCTLEHGELEEQLKRYGELGLYATTVRHEPGKLVIEFVDGVPEDKLERALEVEQACCSFLQIGYARELGHLVVEAPGADADVVLGAIAGALAAGAH
jgi:hypothetical protein